MRRIALITLTLITAVAASADAAEVNPIVGRLGVGDAAFWDESVATHGNGAQVTRRFRLELTDAGQTLRVGLTGTPMRTNVTMTLRDPGGITRHDGTVGFNSGEVFVDDPPVGTWNISVRSPASEVYRMRARLEAAPGPNPFPAQTLLPNLQLIPPYEFSFSTNTINVNGESPTGSCTPDDIVQFGARRCLRFSVGPANVGVGPFHVRFTPLEGIAIEGQAYQVVYDTDGNTTERPAGTFLYHKTHGHYHHSGFGSLELLAVDPSTSTMRVVGAGPKQGFCTLDVMMYDFARFTQSRDHTPSECGDTAGGFATGPTGTQMAVSAGWADIYVRSQDGNYVEFGENGDGRYVVRSTTDALGWVWESDETDNTSYAYVDIQGDTITVLERGFGSGPFDPAKRLADDRYPANP